MRVVQSSHNRQRNLILAGSFFGLALLIIWGIETINYTPEVFWMNLVEGFILWLFILYAGYLIWQINDNHKQLAQVEEQCHKFEFTCQSIVESIPGFILIIDSNKNVVFTNNQTSTALGYQENELLSVSFEKLIWKQRNDYYVPYIINFDRVHDSVNEDEETVLITKEGARLPVSLKLQPIQIVDESYLLCCLMLINETTR